MVGKAVVLTATLLAEPGSATMEETLVAAEAATLFVGERVELATEWAEERADEAASMKEERRDATVDGGEAMVLMGQIAEEVTPDGTLAAVGKFEEMELPKEDDEGILGH